MPEYHFETHAPVELYVEIGKGRVAVTCTDTTESTVHVEGTNADDVLVEQSGDRIRVLEQRRGGLFRDNSLEVRVVVPLHSHPGVKTGSADVAVLGAAGHAHLRTGSGNVSLERASGDVQVESGSGDVALGNLDAPARVKTGSGDISVVTSAAGLRVSTGSGDVHVEEAYGETAVKTGSGDLRVQRAHDEVSLSTGSGDLTVDRIDRGRVNAKGASGDVQVGVAAGVPVWTDVTTVTGSISSGLKGAGQPAEGQDHVEVRAKTASGDIVLAEA
jgi:DUF4097 and DUF4098 domain-containing protein YvlB